MKSSAARKSASSVEFIIEKIIYLSLFVILFILPFPRGLFFEKEILPTEISLFAIFLLWTIYKIISRQKFKFNSFLTLSILILPLAYLLPLILGYAANKTIALNYFLRYSSYLVIFIIVSDMTKTKSHLNIWLYALILSGICTAILGIDSLAAGNLGEKFGLSNIGYQFNRLYGVMQYPNTTGMHYGMLFFVLVAISILAESKFIKLACSSLMFVMLTCLMLTISRGAIILMPVIYLVALILLPKKEQRIELVLTSITPILLTLLIYNPLQKASPIIEPNTGNASKVWILIVAGMIITLLITFGLLFLTKTLNKISQKTYTIVFIILAVIAIAAIIGFFATGLYAKVLPQDLIDRFLQRGSDATSGRTEFYKDGLRVLKDNWLLGSGGGAWNALYRSYQSYDYGSTEAHNMLLQVWLETGIIGIAAYLSLIFFAIKAYFDCRKQNQNSDIAILILVIIAYAISHSMVDFDFSYFSIPIIVFTLFGALNGLCISSKPSKKLEKVSTPAWVLTAISASYIIILGCFMISRNYSIKATNIIREELSKTDNSLQTSSIEGINEAINKMLLAVKFNPWNVDYYIVNGNSQVDLNRLCTWVKQLIPKDELPDDIKNLHLNVIREALKLNSKSSEINGIAAKFFIEESNFDEGLKYVENSLKYSPMQPGRYETVANAYYTIGDAYISLGDETTARTYFERILELENDVAEVNKRASKPVTLSEGTLDTIEKSKQILK